MEPRALVCLLRLAKIFVGQGYFQQTAKTEVGVCGEETSVQLRSGGVRLWNQGLATLALPPQLTPLKNERPVPVLGGPQPDLPCPSLCEGYYPPVTIARCQNGEAVQRDSGQAPMGG